LQRFKSLFTLLPDTPEIYPRWETLVAHHQVSGKLAHDARLVAAMQVHRLNSILTFDKAGFSRYDRIEVLDPHDVTRILGQ